MNGKVLLTVSFCGTAYCGYQVQPNGVTVQEMLNKAAEALFGYPCDVVGCSRTDSGVHARRFCATIAKKGERTLPTAIGIERIPRAMNAHLPADIAVREAREVPPDFHARYDVAYKEYEYLIWNGRERDPFMEGRAWHIPVPIGESELAAMRAAAAHFVGKRDFAAFCAASADTADSDTVRRVTRAEITREGDLISFRVRADGFLYNMVRIMVGTLADVAAGRIVPDAIEEILASRDRRKAGSTAPACGLYLDQVSYEKED